MPGGFALCFVVRVLGPVDATDVVVDDDDDDDVK